MGTRVEIISKDSIDLNSDSIVSKNPIRVYNIDDSFSDAELSIIDKTLADPIVETSTFQGQIVAHLPSKEYYALKDSHSLIEIAPKPGVSDPEGNATKKTLERILGKDIGGVSYSTMYIIKGSVDENDVNHKKELGNPLINDFFYFDAKKNIGKKGIGFHFPKVNLPNVEAFTYKLTERGLILDKNTSDEDLVLISNVRGVELNLKEMQSIRSLFEDKSYLVIRDRIGLEAKLTDAEIELLGQKWSEHCIHKKFKGIWEYTSDDPNDESGLSNIIDNMFKSIIMDTTYKIRERFNWIISVFDDNAGVIELNGQWNIAHKVETHNHPSGLDPFGGSNTGSGGVFRDPKHTGKGMIVVSSQYGFRVPILNGYDDLPDDILDGLKIRSGIVSGVEDYGNKMGIPTGMGNILYDNSWLKPAVYVGAVSVQRSFINRKPSNIKNVKPGFIAVTLGGRVGKDGIHGATASSTGLEPDAEKSDKINQSVQIGDPIVEKNYFTAMDEMLKEDLIEASQDCGAGGWNSAFSELAELSNGGTLDLTNVLEKYKGLAGWEKLVSEAQERGILVVHEKNKRRVLELAEHFNAEATVIGEFNDSGFYKVIDQGKTIAFMPMEFMEQNLPRMNIKAHYSPTKNKEPELQLPSNLKTLMHNYLGSDNIGSTEWISTRYDHEVGGGSIIKPIIGRGRGKSDAIAYKPWLTVKEVVIETMGSNPWQGQIDGYHMGKNNVVDVAGRIIAMGGGLSDSKGFKMTNNGNTTCAKPEKDPEVAAQVLRMLKGAADAEEAFGIPRISGKDSTSMERKYISTKTGKEVHVKAKTELLVSGLGVIPDKSTIISADFKLPGDLIYVVGETRDELGGSELYKMYDEIGKNVPKSDLEELTSRYSAMQEAIHSGIVHSAHYTSNSGLMWSLANSSIAGNLGAKIDLDGIENNLGNAVKILYSGTTGRYVVTVRDNNAEKFEDIMKGQYVKKIGEVTFNLDFVIKHKGVDVIKSNVEEMRNNYNGEET